MIKELIIDGKRSYTDFGLMIAERHISNPKKKSIKESIPFSNVVYDFSNINGEIYWEERTLTYTFDIAEFTTEEMEAVKSDVMDWLMNVHDQDIYDPYIGDYHFHGSFDSDSWEEDFGAGTINVSFLVYPYKISNYDTIKIESFGVSDGLIEGNYTIAGVKIDGKSTQKTRSGKNLFNLQSYFNSAGWTRCQKTLLENGIKLDFTQGEDVYIGTVVGTGYALAEEVRSGCIKVKPNTIYTLQVSSTPKCYISFLNDSYVGTDGYVELPQNYNKSVYSFVTNSETTFLYLRFGIQNENYSTYTFTNIQLEESESASEYESFGVSPSPNYPSEIESMETILINSCGKNILNTPYTPTNKLTHTATKDDHWIVTDYSVYLEAEKTYTVSFETDGEVRGSNGEDTVECYLLLDKGYDYVQPVNKNPITITPIKSGRYYLRCDVNKSGCTHSFWNFQIECGKVKTKFEVYKGSSKTLTLNDPLRSLPNGVCDTYKDGVITRRVGVLTLSGKESWYYEPSWKNKNAFYSKDLEWDPKFVEGYFVVANLLCSHLKVYQPDTIALMDGSGIGQANTSLYISIEEIESVEALSNYLTENPITILYELATPTIETAERPTITSYAPITNVWVDEDTTFEVYYNETKTISIYNYSSHRIAPKIEVEGNINITLNNVTYGISDGIYENAFYLEAGSNSLKLNGYGTIKFSFKGERF